MMGLRSIKTALRSKLSPLLVGGRQKYFCIGQNKTGTTSLRKAFEKLGYVPGNQDRAERLLRFYRQGEWGQIVRYCSNAEVFQDFPFSYPETYKYLDEAFPDSKFILTVRNDSKQWYDSLVRYHAEILGVRGKPRQSDLQKSTYVWQGWMWEAYETRFGDPVAGELYDEAFLRREYERYNADVFNYFGERPEDLLIINVGQPGSYSKFVNFLEDIVSPDDEFPWANKTAAAAPFGDRRE